MSTVDPAALEDWTEANRRARRQYNAMPIAANGGNYATPCLRCGTPTREPKGYCPSCRRRRK